MEYRLERFTFPALYDVDAIRGSHPPVNTPPYGYDRIMDTLSSSPNPVGPGR